VSIQLGTGSHREAQAAMLINRCYGLFGSIGSLSDNFTGGGPLDAPMVMPAGSLNSTEWRNGRGDAIVAATEVRRDA